MRRSMLGVHSNSSFRYCILQMPIGSSTAVRSPWSAAPPPAGVDDDKESLPDTDGGEPSASGAGSGSQMSQGTSPVASGETAPMRGKSRAPVIPSLHAPAMSPQEIAIRALMIPVWMLIGALIAAAAFWYWR